MIAAVFTMFLFVWFFPVWLPVLVGLLARGIRPGVRVALIAAGVLSGVYTGTREFGGEDDHILKLLLIPLPTVLLSVWLMVTGVGLATVHRYARANDATAPACILSLIWVAMSVLLWPLLLFPYLDQPFR